VCCSVRCWACVSVYTSFTGARIIGLSIYITNCFRHGNGWHDLDSVRQDIPSAIHSTVSRSLVVARYIRIDAAALLSRVEREREREKAIRREGKRGATKRFYLLAGSNRAESRVIERVIVGNGLLPFQPFASWHTNGFVDARQAQRRFHTAATRQFAHGCRPGPRSTSYGLVGPTSCDSNFAHEY
jgi:hypothetical protein